MSVWSYFRANFGSIPSGWSPRGGQTYSAYSSSLKPCGSSTGSAVGVSAGFSPLALAAETDGSIICPGNRAALYAMKPTVGLTESGGGLFSIGGAVPVARSMDSVGVMAKGVWDLTAAMEVLVEDYDAGRKSWGYWGAVEVGRRDLWRGLRIGVGSRKVYFDPEIVGSKRVVEACEEAVKRLRSLGAVVVEVDMPGLEAALTHKDEQIITRPSPSSHIFPANRCRYGVQRRPRTIPLHPHQHLPPQPFGCNRLQQRPHPYRNARKSLLPRKLSGISKNLAGLGRIPYHERKRSHQLPRARNRLCTQIV
jgi:Asp-tRNA(Asn)/Glu-tRNA(Gln) amidotransferase A subunit family amidase